MGFIVTSYDLRLPYLLASEQTDPYTLLDTDPRDSNKGQQVAKVNILLLELKTGFDHEMSLKTLIEPKKNWK